jgi:hypothetical protein
LSSVSTEFEKSLAFGQTAESLIAVWLRGRGYTVVPVYEKLFDTGKGPQVFTPTAELVAPDMLVFKGDRALWIEAKHKTAFTWHRLTGRWVTGVDLRHYENYCKVDDTTPWPVWLLFFHRGGQAKDSPADSPAGLFGNTLAYLRAHENHRHDNWGRSGMVYWAYGSLRQLATRDELPAPHAQNLAIIPDSQNR